MPATYNADSYVDLFETRTTLGDRIVNGPAVAFLILAIYFCVAFTIFASCLVHHFKKRFPVLPATPKPKYTPVTNTRPQITKQEDNLPGVENTGRALGQDEPANGAI
jgi:hypothetical protein